VVQGVKSVDDSAPVGHEQQHLALATLEIRGGDNSSGEGAQSGTSDLLLAFPGLKVLLMAYS